MVFDNVNSVVKPVNTTAQNATQTLTIPNLVIPKSGYVYIYFSNESNTTVYFDNFMLTDVRGPILEMDAYYPFGLTMAGISDKALKTPYAENKYRFGGKELQHQEFSDGTGLEEYDFGKRMQDPQLGRWWRIDPLAEFDRKWSPYNYAKDNPIRYLDPDGMWTEDANGGYSTTDANEIKTYLNFLTNKSDDDDDPGQRKAAIDKSKEYVDKKADGNQYQMGAKGKPGEKVDCSGMVGACVVAGGEPDPNHGNGGSGVVNIQNNTKKVADKDVVAGNIVTFYFDDGYPYHTGLLTDVVKDKDGNITSFTMRQSSSGIGPNETTVTVGQGKLGSNIAGYYKWDTKPDPTSNGGNNSEYNRLIQIANYAEQKGLSNAAAYYRSEAQKVKSK
jgi:RHS repeat-associated protein